MPKRDTYESDGGFVEDAPKSKKQRSSTSSAGLKDDEGNTYWEISGTRRIQISDFKGKSMVNIREFYEKDGKTLPGKKGISLPIEQYTALVNLLPQIEEVLHSKGITVPRPDYDEERPTKRNGSGQDEDEEDEEEEPVKPTKKSQGKKNHEATDDEDDEDD